MNLQEPATRMSTTYGPEQGTVYILDEPEAVRKKVSSAVTDSGTEVRRGPDKAGITNLIEIVSVIRDGGPEEIEREFEGSGYGDFKGVVADAVVEYLAPVSQRYTELRPDEGAIEETLAAGAEKARAIAARPSPTFETRWVSVRPAGEAAGPPSTFRTMRAAELDLDLDVFAGPFDLLMAVVLREEIAPRRGVAGRDRRRLHRAPRALGRARSRCRDRVPRPDRVAPGAEVASAAAGRRRRSSPSWGPRRRPTSSWRGCSSTGAIARRQRTWPACSPTGAATCIERRRSRRSCAARR